MASAGDDKHTEILDVIEKRLIPDEAAKKARGEVFTPLNLVREMLYGLRKSDPTQIWGVRDGALFEDDPEDRIGGIPLDVWQNPESKWLDPANGIGNFPFVAFLMLDFQLSKTMKDSPARKKHIVEKMLYMIEIDKGNVNTARKIFETLVPGAKSNICCADTLKLKKDDLTREFGVAEFDVVMGNPPFQTPTTVSGTLRAAQHGTLWDKFVNFSVGILKPNAYLAFITPQTWRKPDDPNWNILAGERHLEYIHILGKKRSSNEFKVSQRVDLYIVKNTPVKSVTIIYDENDDIHRIDTGIWPFLPNYVYDDIWKILVTEGRGIDVIYDSTIYRTEKPRKGSPKVIKTSNDEYKYPVVHSITNKGPVLWYSNTNTKGHFGIPKVLLNKNEKQYPINDFEGTYGMSELTFGIPISSKKEGDDIVTAINSEKFKEIIKATKWGAFQTEHKMFRYFRPDFYKEFLPKKSSSKMIKTRTKARRSRQRAR
jgi:hypothetical protein